MVINSFRFPAFRSLRLKIIAPLALLSLVGSLLGAAIVLDMHEAHLYRQIEIRAANIAQALARSAATHGDTAVLRQIVAAFDTGGDVRRESSSSCFCVLV